MASGAASRLPAPWALAVLAALILLPLALLPGLRFNNAPEVYLPPEAPAVAFEGALRERFPEDQVLVALFEGEGLWRADTLRAMHRVATRLAGHERVERVLGVTTVDHIGATPGGFEVGPLVDPERLAATTAAERRQQAVADPISRGRLVSPDGSAVALVVRPVALAASPERVALEKAVRAAIGEAGLTDHLTAVAGEVALDAAEFRAMMGDSLRFLPITAGLGLALVAFLFRRPLPVVLTAFGMVAVIGPALALLAVWGRPYTLIHAMVGPLLTGLSVALALHLFNAVAHAARRGLAGPERVARALTEVARPARLTAATTAAGLASLGLSPIPPIRSFGLITAAGTILVWVVFGVLVPALVARWDRQPWPVGPSGRRLAGVVRGLAHLGVRRAGWVVAAFGVVLAAGVPWLTAVRAETDLYRFFAPDHPLIRSVDRIETELAGVTQLEVVFRGPRRDALVEPQRLRAIAAFQGWAAAQPEVDRTLSPADFVAEMNWAFRGEAPEARRIPDSRALVAQYLLVYDGRDLYDLLDRDRRTARVVMSLNVHGANAIQAVMARIRQRLETAAPPGLDWRVAGTGRLFADQEDLLVTGQVWSILAVVAAVFAILALAWRSLRAALLAMVPNLSPVLLIFVLMGLFGIWLDMATALIASVAVGIAVDDTIHTYEGIRRRRRAGRGLVLALLRTYRQAGQAVTATTVILVAQFLVLGLSDFRPIAHFGLLSGGGIAAAWLFDLLLLPALLVVAHRLGGAPSGRRAGAHTGGK